MTAIERIGRILVNHYRLLALGNAFCHTDIVRVVPVLELFHIPTNAAHKFPETKNNLLGELKR